MKELERQIFLTICNYKKENVCPLYDSVADISGQAYDVHIKTERNGWKELSFKLPSIYQTENGQEENFRSHFLKADYLIKSVEVFSKDFSEIDWFVISEPKITHNAFSKTIDVTAGHISQLLKTKNLGLEFSDDYGNNVGTAKELLDTVLKGTTWTSGYVYPFAEKDGKTKYRSLKAASKTGAFKLISMICELFDAKPIYHGETQTIDIVPINPFSEPAPGEAPDVSLASDVIELHYGINVKNVARKLNTENMVTKLYASGSYGDKVSGYCGIDECLHTEFSYTLTSNCTKGNTYKFSFVDDSKVKVTKEFTPTRDLQSGTLLIYSLLDKASMSYIWDETNKCAYEVFNDSNLQYSFIPSSDPVSSKVKNWFPFIMDFDYYRSIGLFDDNALKSLSVYQRTMPKKYEKLNKILSDMADARTNISKLIGAIDYCKLDISREEKLLGDGYIVLSLDKTTYEDGIIYRTDYDKRKDNQFKWNVTDQLDSKGDPINAAASIVFVMHNTNSITWDKAYLKHLDDDKNPTALTLWAASGSIQINPDTDSFFLFSYNGINGHIGSLEASDESALSALEEALTIVTMKHPVIYSDKAPELVSTDSIKEYGWLWRYNPGFDSEMYFINKNKNETEWNYVYFTNTQPGNGLTNQYWYDWKRSVLYRYENSKWTILDNEADRRIAEMFSTVYTLSKARDRYYQGISEFHTYTVPNNETCVAGNYIIKNKYDSYWAFSSTEDLNAGDSFTYNFNTSFIDQEKSKVKTILKPKGYRFDNVAYHKDNILQDISIENGNLNPLDGAPEENSDTVKNSRTQSFIPVVPSDIYTVLGLQQEAYVHCYNDKKHWLIAKKIVGNSFQIPAECTFVKFTFNCSVEDFSSYNSIKISSIHLTDCIVIDDLNYKILAPITTNGKNIGLYPCWQEFLSNSDDLYQTMYTQYKTMQNDIADFEHAFMDALGMMYKEGWWQDQNYIDGDEQKLYDDALDNLNHISKPDPAYTVSYFDLYTSNANDENACASEESVNVNWPDLSIMSAVHLIDPEISINTWAYIDKIDKVYDKPWETKITLNTNLSEATQHSFTDVMSNIAEVASKMKGKESYYDKTLGTSVDNGTFSDVIAAISKNQKDFILTFNQVEKIGDTLIHQSSKLKQTADEISAEVERAVNADNRTVARLKITSDKIDAEVIRATEAEGQLSSKITATAESITSEVNRATKAEEALSSNITQTAAGIHTSVTKEIGDAVKAETERATKAESTLTQTATNITSRVESNEKSIAANGTSIDNINKNSIITQTAATIRAVVSEKTDLNTFQTSSVVINKDGVTIDTGGSFNVNADSSCNVQSGGSFNVSAGGTFTVDSDNFSVNSNGVVSAQEAYLSGVLESNGYPVLTKNDVIVSTAEPASPKFGTIWIKPGPPSGGPSQATTIVCPYSGTVSMSGRRWLGPSETDIRRVNDVQITGTGAVAVSPNCKYSVTVPIYIGDQVGERSGGQLYVRITNGQGGRIVLTQEVSGRNNGYGAGQITFDSPFSTWLCSNGNVPLSVLYVSMWCAPLGGMDATRVWNQNGTIYVTCTSYPT